MAREFHLRRFPQQRISILNVAMLYSDGSPAVLRVQLHSTKETACIRPESIVPHPTTEEIGEASQVTTSGRAENTSTAEESKAVSPSSMEVL